jgi:hypothetical protein
MEVGALALYTASVTRLTGYWVSIRTEEWYRYTKRIKTRPTKACPGQAPA